MPGPALDPSVIQSLRQLTSPGEADVLQEILQLFVSDVPRRLEHLRTAVEEEDAVAIHRVAHSIVGSAGNLGAHALHDAARALDAMARSGELTGAREAMDLLVQEFGRVSDEIRQMLA